MGGVMTFVCLTTDIGHECANCTDASWFYRGEQPIENAQGVKFCSVECADEYDTRVEAERAHRASDWCPACGFDNHEHQDWCPTLEVRTNEHGNVIDYGPQFGEGESS